MKCRRKRRSTARSRAPGPKFPIATVAYYGPDDKTPVKVAVGIVEKPDEMPVALRRWFGDNVVNDPKIVKEISDFITAHGAKSVMITDGIIGCPHEEGIDYPEGQDCPFCPFWKGKQ